MLTIIVAMDEDQAIGYQGRLPWHLAQDLKLFKATTWDGKVLMGKVTYENLPRQLEHRTFFVATKNPDYQDPNVTVVNDLVAFARQHEYDNEEYFVCGGAGVYTSCYPYCHKALVSKVKGHHQADTYFSAFHQSDWLVVKKEEYPDFTYCEMLRKGDCDPCGLTI
jgi:dihydrofolate reductase